MSQETDTLCIPNISPAERRKRLNSGILMFIISLGVLAVLLVIGVNLWWRLILFPLFMVAASGYFQWRDKT